MVQRLRSLLKGQEQPIRPWLSPRVLGPLETEVGM